MNSHDCEQLEDYLLGDMTGVAHAEFERHLGDCEACRVEVSQQAHFDGVLKRAVELADPCPPHLTAGVGAFVAVRRQRRAGVLIGVVAAAVVLFLLGLFFPGKPVEPRPGSNPVAGVPDIKPKPARPPVIAKKPQLPRVRVDFPSTVLAEPVDSGDPTITIYRVFPVEQISTKD